MKHKLIIADILIGTENIPQLRLVSEKFFDKSEITRPLLPSDIIKCIGEFLVPALSVDISDVSKLIYEYPVKFTLGVFENIFVFPFFVTNKLLIVICP